MSRASFATSLCAFALALACAAMWLLAPSPSAAPVASSLGPPAIDDRDPLVAAAPSSPPSAFALPSRAEIVSALFDRYANTERSLRTVNFATLNDLLSKISLELPDAEVSRNKLDITITQLKCKNLNVRDIRVAHAVESSTSQRIDVNIEGLRVECEFRWDYKFTIFGGGGWGKARLDPASSASVGLRFLSEDYDARPPHDVGVPHCRPNIQIEDMEYDGDGLGIIGGILNLFESLLRDPIEGELGDVVCEELRGLGDDAMDDLLMRLSGELDAYLGPLDSRLADPLHVESTVEVPIVDDGHNAGEPSYLDFQRLEEYAGEWVNSALDKVDSFLGTSESTSFGNLGINKFIRENFLTNGKLDLDPSLFFESGVVFEGHDMLTQTAISIKSVQIEGLDSFKGMDLLNAIGKYTLRNKLELDYLYVVMEMEAEMKASSRSDAVVVAPNSPTIVEEFTIDFAARGIEIDASIFLGVDMETLGGLELGSVLHSKNILPCLLSAVDDARFSGLSLSVSDMIPPTLEGFIDGGIDHLMSTAADALFEMYEKVLIRAMPNFFQTKVREMVNDFIDDALDVYSCPTNDAVELDQYVDFRDLFLPAEEAVLVGGSGDGRHGNVVPQVMNIIEDQLLSADENGLLGVNMLVASLTEAQSGIEGALKLNGTFLDWNKEMSGDIWRAFADSIRMTLSDLTVDGLDTFRNPIKVLEPRPSSAHLLENQLSLGTADKPLDASVQFRMEVGSATSPLASDNVMDLRLGIPSVEILATLFATVRESRFARFPLRDVLNWSCWLSMIPVSDGERLFSEVNIGLAMHYINVLFDGGMIARTACVSCSNGWLEDLNSILHFLDEKGFVSGLKSRALSTLSDLLRGDWMQGMVDERIRAASQRCPHDAAFGSILAEKTYPTLKGTRDMVDGVLYAALPLVQVAGVVFAQRHSELEIAPPVKISLDAPDNSNLIDFTDLSSIASWANMALEEARSYLGGEINGTTDIGITSVLRSLVLDGNGLMTIPVKDIFHVAGVKFSLFYVTLVGLDSFTMFDVLKASGPNTFSNSVRLERLGVTLKMGLSLEDESGEHAQVLMGRGLNSNKMENVTVSLILKDVELDVSLLMAMDQDLMGELRLGSILNTNHILSCLLSTIHSVGLSDFVVDVGDVEDLSLAGFTSEDTSKSIQNITEAIFAKYKSTILDAFPALTSNTFRPILHDALQVVVDTARDGEACPEPDSSFDGILDFRHLLLSEERALELLGRGDSPYGNLFRLLYSFLEDVLLSADEDGLSKVNDLLVAPLTKSQSGVEGALKINGTLLDLNKEEVTRDIWRAFADNLRLTLSDLSIEGLDTIRAPIEVLKPRPSSANFLDNQLGLGISSKPLDASVRFGIEVGGATSPLATNNIMDLQLSMPSVDVAAVLFATIQESRFMNFPLKDLLNFSCWLSMIPISAKSSAVDIGLAMHNLYVLFDGGIQANASCVSCSNSWLKDFDSILDFLHENDFISSLQSRALSIVSDLSKGDWVQGMVDKQIMAAARRCPHDSAFGSPSFDQKFPTFKGTREMVDGILYAGLPLVQVIAIVIAQKHSDLEVLPPRVDIEVDAPEGANMINLTDLSSVAGWADMALEEVRSYLGGITDSRGLGITRILQSLALDDHGLLTIPFEDEGFEAGGVKLSLYDVTMVGLDSFTLFDVLKASDATRFSNSVRLERLGVILKMGLSVEDASNEQAQRPLLELGSNADQMETITVSLIFKDVYLDVSLLMAMDQDLMGELKLGSILDTNNVLSCLLSTIHSIGLSDFVMGIGDVSEFSISGFISDDTHKSIQRLTEAILTEYKPLVLGAIPAFTSTTIRPILDDILQVLVEVARDDGSCPEPDSSLDGILDFRDMMLSEERALELLGRGESPYGNLFRMLYGFLEEIMSKADENGLSEMNDLLASLTERQSNEGGELYYAGELFKQDLDIALNGLNAAIELGVSDLRVSNIDSLGAPVKVLQPVKGESSVLNNTASIGVGVNPFRTEFRLLIKGKGNEVEVHNDLVLGLSLENVGVMLEVLVQIIETPFLNFPLQDVLNLQCWLATVVTPSLDKFGIRVGEPDSGIVLKKLALAAAEARLDIECISCSSPLIVEMSSKLGSQEAVDDTTAVANMIFDYVSNLLGGDFVQSGLDKLLNEAAMKCPNSPSYNQNFLGLKYEELTSPEKGGDSYGFLIAIISVIAVSVVVAAVIFVATRRVSMRRHNRWVNTLNRPQKLELEKIQNDEKEREKDLNNRMSSLVRSKEVPLFLRLLIPVVIIGNIALFLSGHLSLGGTVNIRGTFAGQYFDIQGFFEFSMAKSTIEMWNAGAKSLAILIVIFSGVWPYSKLLITLFIWFAPPRWLSSNRRGKLLHWLDILGKWSMVDVFVLLMTLASFHLSISSPSHLNFLPEGLYSIKMLVVPLWGLYANMLAQFVAQISSHVIIHYHRKTAMAAAHSQEVEWDLVPANSDESPEKLGMHRFKLDYEASSKRAIVHKSVHWVLSAAMLLFAILVICGCTLPSFGIEVFGLVGLVVESGNQFEQARDLYSVFDLGSMIMDQGRYLNTASDIVGLGTLASLLVITVFLVPLVQALSLFAQWFAPMTKKQRMQNTVLNEILSAWQYIEVYVLSIIIAAWQLGGVSEYMINEYCDPLQSTFSSLSYYGILSQDDAQCFKVDATVESASWILVAASLILWVLNHFIMGASSQKASDDDIPADHRLHTDRWLQSKQSTVSFGVDMSVTMSMSNDVETGSDDSYPREVCLSPIKPRFTDYYFFATAHQGEEPVQEYEAETAILPIDENRSDDWSSAKNSVARCTLSC